jgi:hypothetical protein
MHEDKKYYNSTNHKVLVDTCLYARGLLSPLVYIVQTLFVLVVPLSMSNGPS